MKKLLFTISFCLTLSGVSAQICDTSALIVEPVRASDTDASIAFELAQHYTFYNPSCTPKNVLLVHMVGTFGDPYQTIYFPSLAANHGFHVLSLKYPNDLSAQTACGTSNDPDCHYKFRKEIIEGVDYSPEVDVDSVNSINNRLIRLLQYMDANYALQGWGQFFTGDSIHWEQLMMSGHSQGGGHAAVYAINRPLRRVLMFASPNDYSHTFQQTAPWTSMPHAASDSAYYSFNNLYDQVAMYDWQYDAAIDFGEGTFGDTVNVEYDECPYQLSHNLYTSRDSSGFTTNHGMVVNDMNLDFDQYGRPVFERVWAYMLGVDCLPLGLSETKVEEVELVPNPARDRVELTASSVVREVRIVQLDGKIQKTLSVDASEFTLDIQDLNAGIYILQLSVETADGLQSKSMRLQKY